MNNIQKQAKLIEIAQSVTTDPAVLVNLAASAGYTDLNINSIDTVDFLANNQMVLSITFTDEGEEPDSGKLFISIDSNDDILVDF